MAAIDTTPKTGGVRAGFRISSVSMPAEKITTALGIDPDKTMARGAPVHIRNLHLPMPSHMWMLHSSRPDQALERQVEELLGRLENPADVRALNAGGCDAELFVTIKASDRPEVSGISQHLLARLAEYGADLVIEVRYPVTAASLSESEGE